MKSNKFFLITTFLALIIIAIFIRIKLFSSEKNNNSELQLINQNPIIEDVNMNVREIATSELVINTFLGDNKTFSKLVTEEKKIKQSENFYTTEEVAIHNSKESCWSIINGEIYNLTRWIDRHSGGSNNILLLCGKDGTDIFLRKHGNEKKPLSVLNRFKIGKLKESQ